MIPVILLPLLTKLAENGLSLISDAILSKGKDVIEKELDVNLDEAVKSDTGLMQLKQLEMQHEEFLVTAAQKRAEIALEEKKLDLADINSARTANVQIQESSNASFLSKNVGYYIDMFVLVATVLLTVVVVFQAVPEANKEIFYTAFGSMMTFCSTIIQFHRGSSKGSVSKDETIKNLMQVKS
jgi:cytochrome c biogenesis factor